MQFTLSSHEAISPPYCVEDHKMVLRCAEFRRFLQQSGDVTLQFINAVNSRFPGLEATEIRLPYQERPG